MLRSTFSLIQKITDFDPTKKSTKPNTSIVYYYCACRLQSMDATEKSKIFQITNDVGDVITCKQYSSSNLSMKKNDAYQKLQQCKRTSFINKGNSDVQKDVTTLEPNAKAEVAAPPIKADDSIPKCSIKQSKTVDKDRDQIATMVGQVGKMREGMKTLKEIAHDLNCTDRYKEDVDFLMRHIPPALQKSEKLCKPSTSVRKENTNK